MLKKSKSTKSIKTVEAFMLGLTTRANCTSCNCYGSSCNDDNAYRQNQLDKKSKSNYLQGIGYTN